MKTIFTEIIEGRQIRHIHVVGHNGFTQIQPQVKIFFGSSDCWYGFRFCDKLYEARNCAHHEIRNWEIAKEPD